MDSRFKDVKVIAWDLDTTLYKPIPALSEALINGCVQELAKIKKISFQKAKEIFQKERRKTDSSTQALINLGIGTPRDIFYLVWEIQKKVGKINYLKKDKKLPLIFEKLKNFRHFIISNSVPEEIDAVLDAIGLSKKYFEKLISVVEVGKPKPDPAPFKYLFSLTGLPPKNHLYVGDREKVDIIPAKKLGMKTILVWGKSEVADLSISTIYDIINILI